VRDLWLDDIESLEAISQDEDTRNIFLRMALLSQNGRLRPFLRELREAPELDTRTKDALTELAEDASFLHAVEDYIRRTRAMH
jgi:hypothetical protein